MNADDDASWVVTARLPSGIPIKVEVARPSDNRMAGPSDDEMTGPSDDEMASVGLRHLDLGSALDSVAEISSVVVEKLKAVTPTKATVEFRLGFAVEAGRLTALWVGGRGEASLTVTMEWSGHGDGTTDRHGTADHDG